MAIELSSLQAIFENKNKLMTLLLLTNHRVVPLFFLSVSHYNTFLDRISELAKLTYHENLENALLSERFAEPDESSDVIKFNFVPLFSVRTKRGITSLSLPEPDDPPSSSDFFLKSLESEWNAWKRSCKTAIVTTRFGVNVLLKIKTMDKLYSIFTLGYVFLLILPPSLFIVFSFHVSNNLMPIVFVFWVILNSILYLPLRRRIMPAWWNKLKNLY
ncbi:MAG: hypothetical protein HZA36_03390 [Parcubacteria group bacterium]|nr:hypothetical protein [Parcubacteria group bacterium]